jgi:hypothetical protein
VAERFTVEPNHCGCHPETCSCDPWLIRRDGERFSTCYYRHIADEVAAALNEKYPTPAVKDLTVAEPFYTCCEDGMLSQVPPADRSCLCPACRPATTPQPLLTDEDWQAIADDSRNPLFIIPGRFKELVEERIRLRLAVGVKGLDA